ncbi:MAG: UTP--glucose-1-phosphate uridylyltransferase [Candidatus Nomurabacteria bacterium]|jgi:UTP--glucose-1-phosphate uridylyltransferase|nr:UTP--glucose-1-phosphate uridylyltransferase [Candidatus Nomurabacteria bacterium]
MKNDGLKLAQDKMAAAGVDPTAIKVFAAQYLAMLGGSDGNIAENAITPVEKLEKLDDVKVDVAAQQAAIGKTVIIKLNGGLGASMGLAKTKSLLTLRDGQTFLDIVVKQILRARADYGARLPLILMNSFHTRQESLDFIKKYPELPVGDLPLDFLQNRVPKLRLDNLQPVDWPADPELEWSPPGHGDIYTALLDGGLLDKLIADGYEYAHVSNSDNLGATPNAILAGWFAQSGAPFAIEACRRTVNDKKGGHLALRKADDRLILRESAQTTEADKPEFMNIDKHRFFNSNNIWLNLPALREALRVADGVLDLPFIRNEKNVDPTDLTTPKVIQLESAMGSAIEKLDGATAIEVPRSRFLPVKTTNELLLVRSDLYKLTENYHLEPQVEKTPEVSLDDRYYKLINDFDARFVVVPSLIQATSFIVKGDWLFDKPSAVVGNIYLSDTGQQAEYSGLDSGSSPE